MENNDYQNEARINEIIWIKDEINDDNKIQHTDLHTNEEEMVNMEQDKKKVNSLNSINSSKNNDKERADVKNPSIFPKILFEFLKNLKPEVSEAIKHDEISLSEILLKIEEINPNDIESINKSPYNDEIKQYLLKDPSHLEKFHKLIFKTIRKKQDWRDKYKNNDIPNQNKLDNRVDYPINHNYNIHKINEQVQNLDNIRQENTNFVDNDNQEMINSKFQSNNSDSIDYLKYSADIDYDDNPIQHETEYSIETKEIMGITNENIYENSSKKKNEKTAKNSNYLKDGYKVEINNDSETIPLSSKILSLIHNINTRLDFIRQIKKVNFNLPHLTNKERNGDIYIGKEIQFNKNRKKTRVRNNLSVKLSDFRSHILINGKTGYGKSNLLKNLLISLQISSYKKKFQDDFISGGAPIFIADMKSEYCRPSREDSNKINHESYFDEEFNKIIRNKFENSESFSEKEYNRRKIHVLKPGFNFKINLFNPGRENPINYSFKLTDMLYDSFGESEKTEFSAQMKYVLSEVLKQTIAGHEDFQCWAGFFCKFAEFITENSSIDNLKNTALAIFNRIKKITSGSLYDVFSTPIENTQFLQNNRNYRSLLEKSDYIKNEYAYMKQRDLETYTLSENMRKSNFPINLHDIPFLNIILDLQAIFIRGSTKHDAVFIANLALNTILINNRMRGNSDKIRHITVVEDAMHYESNDIFSEFFSLQRGYGEISILTNTRPSINEDIIANAGMYISFRQDFGKDTEIAKQKLSLSDEELSYLKLLPKGVCLIKLADIPHSIATLIKKF